MKILSFSFSLFSTGGHRALGSSWVHGKTTGRLPVSEKTCYACFPSCVAFWKQRLQSTSKKKKSIPGILCIWPTAKQLHSAFACQRTEFIYHWIFRPAIACNPSCKDEPLEGCWIPLVMAKRLALVPGKADWELPQVTAELDPWSCSPGGFVPAFSEHKGSWRMALLFRNPIFEATSVPTAVPSPCRLLHKKFHPFHYWSEVLDNLLFKHAAEVGFRCY